MSDQIVHKFGNVEAIRYGDANGEWDEGAPARLAQFVLGHNVNAHVTTLNEGLMRVIQPVDEFWDPKQGLADVVVTDSKTGIRLGLSLGQWIARYPSGILRPLPHNTMVASFFPPPPAESFEVELRKLVAKHGREKGSGSPDYVVADFLADTLTLFNNSVRKRAKARNEIMN